MTVKILMMLLLLASSSWIETTHASAGEEVWSLARKVLISGSRVLSQEERALLNKSDDVMMKALGGEGTTVIRPRSYYAVGTTGMHLSNPGIALRRSLHKIVGYSEDTTWITLVVDNDSVRAYRKVPSYNYDPFNNRFNYLIKELKERNPLFGLSFLERHRENGTYYLEASLGRSRPLGARVPIQGKQVSNSREIMTEGKLFTLYDIPISREDTLDNVLAFLRQLDSSWIHLDMKP